MPPETSRPCEPAEPADLIADELIRWLTSSSGAAVLARVGRELAGHNELAVLTRLRGELGPARAGAAVTQATLRRRALAKFEPDTAARLLFTPVGLEQATRGDIAAYRAGTVAKRLGGTATPILDLGCGIGADLLAFARAGFDTTGVERSASTAAIARANIAALDLTAHARVRVGDATGAAAIRDPDAVLFADPARRNERGRVFDVGGWSPPWPVVLDWLTGTAGVKVGPGIPHRLVPAGVHAEWISVSGRAGAPGGSAAAGLKEAFLTSGALVPGPDRTEPASPGATPSARRFAATVMADDGGFLTLHGDPTSRAGTGSLGDYVYEPDPAVIRAGLVARAAELLEGRLLDPAIAYLTADRPSEQPFARGYRVLEQLPYRVKPLRAVLRARRVGRLTLKKRGVDVDPLQLRRQLLGAHGYGEESATVVFGRAGGKAIALLVEPL